MEAFANADEAGKREIVALTMPLKPFAEQTYTRMQWIVIRTGSVFSYVAGNVIVRWGVAIYAGDLARRVYSHCILYFRAYILPRGINFLINNASLGVIRGVTRGMYITDKLLAYQGTIWITFWLLSWIPPLNRGVIGQTFRWGQRVLLFPDWVVTQAGKVPDRVYNWAFSYSSAAQQKISTDLAGLADRGHARLQQREIEQARRIWMQCINQMTFANE
jgi:hypothetical protein